MKRHMKLVAAFGTIMLGALAMISQGAFADTAPQNVGLIGKVSATEGQLSAVRHPRCRTGSLR